VVHCCKGKERKEFIESMLSGWILFFLFYAANAASAKKAEGFRAVSG